MSLLRATYVLFAACLKAFKKKFDVPIDVRIVPEGFARKSIRPTNSIANGDETFLNSSSKDLRSIPQIDVAKIKVIPKNHQQ